MGTTCRMETGITSCALRGLWLQGVPMGTLLQPPVFSPIPGKAALPGFAAAIPTMVPLQGVLASPKSHQTRPQKQPPLLGNLPVLRQRGQGSTCSCPQHPPTPLSPPYHGVGQGVPGEEGLTHGGWRRWVRGSRAVHGAVLSGRPAVLCPPRVTAWTFSCARTLSPPPDLPVWGIH